MNNFSQLNLRYVSGALIALSLVGVIYFNDKNKDKNENFNQSNDVTVVSETSANRPITDKERHKKATDGSDLKGSGENEKLDVEFVIPKSERQERIKELQDARARMDSPRQTSLSNPDEPLNENHQKLLSVAENQYYVFDDKIMLPLDNKTWVEYEINGSNDGRFEKIMEYYLPEENQNNWTQKFTIHRVNVENPDCFDFVDKLVNGIILSVNDQLYANGIELKTDNLAFNYLKKEKENTEMYWEMRDIPDIYDETQFVRAFIAPKAKQMYLMTYTVKANTSELDNEVILNSIQTLDSIQEI